jgi:hypothetical protein
MAPPPAGGRVAEPRGRGRSLGGRRLDLDSSRLAVGIQHDAQRRVAHRRDATNDAFERDAMVVIPARGQIGGVDRGGRRRLASADHVDFLGLDAADDHPLVCDARDPHEIAGLHDRVRAAEDECHARLVGEKR